MPQQKERRLAVAVADAMWFTTENLFREVPEEVADTLSIKAMDFLNAWRKGQPPWKWGRRTLNVKPGHWEREFVLPSGWMKSFPRIGMRPMASGIRAWHRRVGRTSPLALVMTYPHYRFLSRQVKPDYQLYYNVDDYTLYWPERAEEVRQIELQVVEEADVTVCVSRLRAEELKRLAPSAAGKIFHVPHGAPSSALAPSATDGPMPAPADIAHLPRPLLGYVGNMEDRVDWELVAQLAQARPDASIVLVGHPGGAPEDGWGAQRARALALPNVHALGWRPQWSIHSYNQAFDVCLIPYLPEHPFNRACSPTKIMDCMATARPIVTTALPECLLYENLIRVVPSREEFLNAVSEIIDNGSDDGRAQARLDYARQHTCRIVSEHVLSLIPRN